MVATIATDVDGYAKEAAVRPKIPGRRNEKINDNVRKHSPAARKPKTARSPSAVSTPGP
jgi:hypothetical protein